MLTVVVMLIGLSPLVTALWASDFAQRHGCYLNEDFVQPRIVNGKDWGDTLFAAFVSGWFAFITLPIVVVAMAVFVRLAVIDLIGYVRSK